MHVSIGGGGGNGKGQHQLRSRAKGVNTSVTKGMESVEERLLKRDVLGQRGKGGAWVLGGPDLAQIGGRSRNIS